LVESLGAVGDLVFEFETELGEGFAVSLCGDEDRIVAEAGGAQWFGGDVAFDNALGGLDLTGFGIVDSSNTSETSGSVGVGNFFEKFEEFVDTILVVLAETLGFDSRFAS